VACQPCSYQRPYEAVPSELQDVSNWDDSVGAFSLPEAADVMRKRVVVVTCIMAAKVGGQAAHAYTLYTVNSVVLAHMRPTVVVQLLTGRS
jgi:hypothetical protein